MNRVVPEELDTEIGAGAAQMRALVAAWGQVGSQAGCALRLDSPFSRDRKSFRAAHPNAPENLENAALYVGQYVAAIGQHVLAIIRLFESNQVALSVWPLIRAELEIAGRVAWLLEPGTEDVPVSATQRTARFQMEFLATLCRERFTAGKLNYPGRVRESKARRDRSHTHLLQVFPDADTNWSKPGDENNWVVGGETYAGLGAATKLFAESSMGNVRGLYDVLSDCSHPSLVRLATQSSMVEMGGGVSELRYVVPPDLLEWQARAACMILYQSAHLVAGYFGLDDSPLESWADRVPSRWFAAEEGQ